MNYFLCWISGQSEANIRNYLTGLCDTAYFEPNVVELADDEAFVESDDSKVKFDKDLLKLRRKIKNEYSITKDDDHDKVVRFLHGKYKPTLYCNALTYNSLFFCVAAWCKSRRFVFPKAALKSTSS